jgi:hypothetical protein
MGRSIDDMVRMMHHEGASHRAIARELSIDRRKVKQAIGGPPHDLESDTPTDVRTRQSQR